MTALACTKNCVAVASEGHAVSVFSYNGGDLQMVALAEDPSVGAVPRLRGFPVDIRVRPVREGPDVGMSRRASSGLLASLLRAAADGGPRLCVIIAGAPRAVWGLVVCASGGVIFGALALVVLVVFWPPRAGVGFLLDTEPRGVLVVGARTADALVTWRILGRGNRLGSSPQRVRGRDRGLETRRKLGAAQRLRCNQRLQQLVA